MAIAITTTGGPIVKLSTGACGVFLIAAVARTRNIAPAMAQHVFGKLGDWSYAMYLIHIPVLIVVFKPALAGYGLPVLLIGIIVSVAAAAALGQLDMTTHSCIRKMTLNNDDWRVRCGALAFTAIYFAISIAYA